MPTHLYQLCYNARRMDRHSEAELCALSHRPALHSTPCLNKSTQRLNGRANTCRQCRQ